MTVPSLLPGNTPSSPNRWGVERRLPRDVELDAFRRGFIWYGSRWVQATPEQPELWALRSQVAARLGRPDFSRFGARESGERSNLEQVFADDFSRGLGYVIPDFGSRAGRIMGRNPFAVRSGYERASVGREPGYGTLDFLEHDFDPENFIAGLSSFERGDNPRAFTSRQRRIFR